MVVETDNSKVISYFYCYVSKKLNDFCAQKGLTQQIVNEKCSSLGLDISQSTISKIFGYCKMQKEDQKTIQAPSGMSLIRISYICQALDIDINDVLPSGNGDINLDNIISQKAPSDAAKKGDPFIRDPDHRAYNGYLGKYFCYLYPTRSNETMLLRGELEFKRNSVMPVCDATFKLYTNKGDNFKLYTGQLIISIPQTSCYCIITDTDNGEICMFTFHHRYFIGTSLDCRVASVATTSSGDSRRPTTQRMLICRYEIPCDRIDIVKSQILLNNDTIDITKDTFEVIKDDLPEKIRYLISNMETTQIYSINELSIIDTKFSNEVNVRDDYKILIEAICRLRKFSMAKKYNKVGSKVDELLYNYFSMFINTEKIEE